MAPHSGWDPCLDGGRLAGPCAQLGGRARWQTARLDGISHVGPVSLEAGRGPGTPACLSRGMLLVGGRGHLPGLERGPKMGVWMPPPGLPQPQPRPSLHWVGAGEKRREAVSSESQEKSEKQKQKQPRDGLCFPKQARGSQQPREPGVNMRSGS